MRFLPLVLVFLSGIASAQTLPLRLPQFIEPPASNGADAVLYPNGILYNPTLGCIAGAVAGVWPCLATRQEVAATYMPTATANAAIASVQAGVNANAAAITTLQAGTKWACSNLSVASSITLPLGGLSSTSTVTVSGAPVGTVCGVGTPAFLPLGAEPLAAVATVSTVSIRFQGSVGVIVPAGTYRVCCVL